jgi:hypothetical protein
MWFYAKSCKAARYISTIEDASGYTHLLVGGQGIRRWTAIDAQRKNGPRKQISVADDGFYGIPQLHVTQTSQGISIFANTDSEETVSYCTTPHLDLSLSRSYQRVTAAHFHPSSRQTD